MMTDVYRNRKVGVIGLGRSGLAACRLARKAGAEVFATEMKGDVGDLEELRSLGVVVELGGHSDKVFDSDLAVLSPGIALDTEIVKKARNAGIFLLPELEFAWSLLPTKQFIAVTGTNGKSTTCALIGDILRISGRDVLVGGNIGVPLSSLVPEASADTFIVSEVSTFQLEHIAHFRPWISVLTNITQDHLDRHTDLSTYVALKKRIFENQREDDFSTINLLDPISMEVSADIRAKRYFFANQPEAVRGTFIHDGAVVFRDGQDTELLDLDSIPISKVVSVENVLAATLVASLCGCAPSACAKGVRQFKGLPHRLEEVASRNGVIWINNSMCTNPVAAQTSIMSLQTPVVLIAGGKDKGLDPTPLIDVIVKRVKFTILMGDVSEALGRSLSQRGYGSHTQVDTMDEAVRLAHSVAKEGDSVLLSPGYSSLDMYINFEERGEDFKQSVHRLYGRHDERR